MAETVKVTAQGILIPRPLIQEWGDIQEVEIEQYSDVLIIRPKGQYIGQLHQRVIKEMKEAGLVEDLPWGHPPVVSDERRADLAKRLSQGRPLSEIIIEEREDRA